MEPLVLATDLADFPGAPFSQAVVDAAVGAIRRECGWHIAPLVTETVTLDSPGGSVLLLPTLRLVDVTEVRDVTGATPRVLTRWRKSRAGMLSNGGWPAGFSAVEVDMTHGYEQFPAELLPVVADRALRKVRQETAGPFSTTYDTSEDADLPAILARFKIGSAP